MRKTVVAIIAAALLVSAWLFIPGLAASMTDNSNTEGAGSATIAHCDTDGVTTTFNYSMTAPYPIVSVNVAGIASGCAGQTLNLTVNANDGLTIQSTSATVQAGGGTQTITLPTPAPEKDSTGTEITIG